MRLDFQCNEHHRLNIEYVHGSKLARASEATEECMMQDGDGSLPVWWVLCAKSIVEPPLALRSHTHSYGGQMSHTQTNKI